MDAFMVGMWMQMYARLIVDNLGPPSIGETAKISLEISETYCEIQKKNYSIHLLCGSYTDKLI